MKKQLFFMGDIHGNYAVLKHRVKSRKITDATIIHVGDFGVGFSKYERDVERLVDLNEFLESKNVIVYVCRGNHDNPIFFNGQHIYSNLKLVEDYTVLNINDKNILMVGGALSIDRVPRRKANTDSIYATMEERYYWSTEVFVLDEEKLKNTKDIDIVVTHTCPDFSYPVNLNGDFPRVVTQFASGDPSLIKDLMEERELLTKFWKLVCENSKPTHYYYGHFHSSNEENIHGLSGVVPMTTKFTCLGIDELKLYADDSDYEKELNEKYGQ
jgi:predicted phosphodiesterase